MKKYSITFALLLVFASVSFSQNPAILDLESTTQGVLIPRMTSLEREAIATPAQSLMVYDLTTKSFWYYEDSSWNELLSTSNTGATLNSDTHVLLEPIPDGDPNGVEDVITLSDPRTINDNTVIRICLDISHEFTGDLDISLTASDGTTIIDLVSDKNGDNFFNTCFTSTATIGILTASTPHTGEFIPEQDFTSLNGLTIAGDWKIKVADDNTIQDFGTFSGWSLEILRAEDLVYRISDSDGDTRIEAEKSFDQDQLKFTADGIEVLDLSNTEATFTQNVIAPAFIGDGSMLTGISGGGSGTFYYEFSSFSNSSCCNNMIFQQTNGISAAASISENSTQPKHAYGKPLSFDVEIVSVKFLHRYDDFTLSGTEDITVQTGIASLSGVLDRYVTAPLDLRTAPQDTWIDMPLTSSIPADNLVDAGALQYIVWQLNSAMSGGGNLDGIGILQVEVKIP